MPIRRETGFTLVELLVVIATIALLVALLLPAIQAARSAARKVQCANNFKQVALAVLNYASSNETLPAITNERLNKGQGVVVSGDPEISWRFTVLPYMEEQAFYDVLAPCQWRSEVNRAEEPPILPPVVVASHLCAETPGTPRLDNSLRIVSTADGRIIADSFATHQNLAITWSLDVSRPDNDPPFGLGAWYGRKRATQDPWSSGAWIRPARVPWITDGLSKTMLVAEQAGAPERIRGAAKETAMGHWQTWIYGSWDQKGLHIGGASSLSPNFGLSDDESAYRPINWGNVSQIFSFHPGGAHVSMCDGSVRFLSEDSSTETVFAMATRNGAVLNEQ